MLMSHSLLECPLYNCATLTLDSTTRIITHASSDMMQLLERDVTGTPWPSKQDQQLCFTTLVKVQSGQQYKRLLTCEHINSDDPTITTIHCAELSKLDTTLAFFYALTPQQFNNKPTIIIRLSPYGVVLSAFSENYSTTTSWMIGRPLMGFIHNDDIPTLCNGLRQVTQDDRDEIVMVSFDIRCNFDATSLHHAIRHERLYHFSTTITSSRDILCVIRPALPTNDNAPTQPAWRIPQQTTSSTPSYSRVYSALIQLSQMVRSPYSKGKDMISSLQQILWDALEQGWMMLAHFLAVVVVLALHYYRMARYPSFWLETSELALRCVVAETSSRHELDRLLSWLDWSQQPWLDSALDHGSEWFSSPLRSHVYSF